jgi:hypothetical protein
LSRLSVLGRQLRSPLLLLLVFAAGASALTGEWVDAEQVPSADVVPGDVVLLSAGSLVPADAVVLEAIDFFVSEAVLTGESFPVQKQKGLLAASAELVERTNCVFLGTNVRSGTARCLVVATGSATAFGAIAHRLTLVRQRPNSIEEFDASATCSRARCWSWCWWSSWRTCFAAGRRSRPSCSRLPSRWDSARSCCRRS